MTDWLHLDGIRLYAHQGVYPEERELGRTLRIDVALAYDVSRAGRSDDLSDTIDYELVYRLVRDAVAEVPRSLGERVAEDVAARLLTGTPASAVRVRVTKPDPPIAGASIDEQSVEIERRR